MTKFILATTLALGLAATSALAQEVKVPTGIDVPGCARYVVVDGKVVQDCSATTDPVRVTNPNDPQSAVRSTGGNE